MREKLRHDLNTVRADFDTWRQRRRGRERIPDVLWAAAVDLLDHYPFSVVRRTLRLNAQALRQRRTAAGHPPSHSRPSSSAFLELTAHELATATKTLAQKGGAAHASPPAETTCAVVLERNDGHRLRLRLPLDWSHLEALCTRFLGRI